MQRWLQGNKLKACLELNFEDKHTWTATELAQAANVIRTLCTVKISDMIRAREQSASNSTSSGIVLAASASPISADELAKLRDAPSAPPSDELPAIPGPN